MPTFAKSLGVKCEACHDTNNFKACDAEEARRLEDVAATSSSDWRWRTARRSIATRVTAGTREFLDRHDKKALSAWMDTNYVKKLKRTDKKEHSASAVTAIRSSRTSSPTWRSTPRQ